MARRAKRAPGVQLGEEVARGMIIAAGARVFAAKGLRAASVEDVLEAAKVSRRTFYRLFESKEDVALALYNFGTKGLIENWRRAVTASADPVELFTKIIEIQLNNAAMMGRLVFVLGGEASRQESPLHARRMKVHADLVEMLRASHPDNARIDPLIVRTTIYALEAVIRQVLEQSDEGRSVDRALLERARKVMIHFVTAGFAASRAELAASDQESR